METVSRFTFIPVLVLMFINIVDAETLRQRLFKEDDGPCDFSQFKCQNNECILRSQLCNNRHDCSDRSDENYCQTNGNCPSHRSFTCRHGNYYKCIPQSWKCDGLVDCARGEDEANCEADKGILKSGNIQWGKILAQNWTLQLRKEEQPIRKWGSDVERIAVALYLSNDTNFRENRTTIRDEIIYELSMSLLSRLALKKIEDVSSSELASYVNAFLVTCIDPRKFYVVDMVDELRKRVDAQNYINPYVMIALCNAGDRITENDVQKLTDVFWKAHTEFWTDTQALAVLALACAAEQPFGVTDLGEIRKLTMELKKRQYRNGTVENLKTTALVMQALFATESEADEDNFDEEKALKQILRSQKKNGSFGNLANTYYVLPVLGYKSLVNISSSHCKITLVDEKETLEDLMNQVGEKWRVQFSLWVGDNITIERTLTLNVPANTSFYRVMEFAAGVDSKYRFEYSMKNGKPYISSISDIQDDPEHGMFWFLFETAPATELKPLTRSPADIVPRNKQHYVFWYKCGSWNHQ